MQHWLKEVARGKRGSKDLNYAQTRELAQTIVEGQATDAQIAAYLVAQRLKTESSEELLAFIHVLQQNSKKLNLPSSFTDNAIDFAGPCNGRNSFAATIPVSILLAEYGIPSFLHSSDSLPPKYGIAIKEILSEMGIAVNPPSNLLAETIAECNIGFAWTEKYCSPLSELRPVREQIGVRTLLNTAEKLLNITQSKSLMMGAFHRTAINKIFPIFKGLSFDHVVIVQGLEGSEDVPVHRNSFVYKITEKALDSFIVRPGDYGVLDKQYDKDRRLTAKEQSDFILAILSGDKFGQLSYYYNQVLFNAGLRYYLFHIVKSIEEGIEIAREQLSKQKGLLQLNKWKNSLSVNTEVI